jgi:hypothetical protein
VIILGPLLAQGCRLGRCSEVGSFLGYTGRGADIVAATAHDPQETFDASNSGPRIYRATPIRKARTAPSPPNAARPPLVVTDIV